MTINCPKCGNEGRSDCMDGRFEARGPDKGHAVRKCATCSSGLLIGPFSGVLFGSPKVIADRRWFDMEAQWARRFSSSELSDDDRDELGLMFHSMFGFAHGYAGLYIETGTSGVASPEQSFFLNALRAMCVNYFIGTSTSPSDVNLRHIVEKHGLSSLLAPIDSLLHTSLGSTTFEGVLKRFRNKYLTHELFQLQPFERIYRDYDLHDESNLSRYNRLEDDLFKETEKLFYDLRERFPEAWFVMGDTTS